MSDWQQGSGHGSGDGGPWDPPAGDFERFLLDTSRVDVPEESLEGRILDGLAYRSRLERMARPGRSSRAVVGWSAAAALAMAAAAALVVRARSPSRGPEVTAETGATVSASARATPKAIVDPCLHRLRAAGSEPAIDDFEDGDDAILPLEGRKALWRWTRDTDAPGTAPALLPIPRPDPRRSNRLAVHVKGDKLRDWGAAIELTFQPGCYDASAYAGLAFSARGPGRVYLSPREVSVITVALGGTCQSDCFNGHVHKVELEDRWRDYEVRWSEVEQRGYGKPVIDPSRLHDIAFLVRPEDTPYDVWLDDLRFLQR
jgi:hypothetical protein